MMTSEQMFEIIDRNLRGGAIPTDAVAISKIAARVSADASPEEQSAADGVARMARIQVHSAQALNAQFATGNYQDPTTGVELSDEERAQDSIVKFGFEILVQLLALRQAINDSDKNAAPILKPFTYGDLQINEDELKNYRAEILRFLNEQSQANLDEARDFINNAIRKISLDNLDQPIELKIGNRTLNIDGRCFVMANMHAISEVEPLTAGQISMADVAMSTEEYDNVQNSILENLKNAEKLLSDSKKIIGSELFKGLVQESEALRQLMPSVSNDAAQIKKLVEQAISHVEAATQDKPVSIQGNCHQLKQIAEEAQQVPHNASAHKTLKNKLQNSELSLANAQEHGRKMKESIRSAILLLDKMRENVREDLKKYSDQSADLASQAVNAAQAANGMVDEVADLLLIAPAASNDADIVKAQVGEAHHHANGENNDQSAQNQAALAKQNVELAENMLAPSTQPSEENFTVKQKVEAVKSAEAAYKGAQEAARNNKIAIKKANDALKRVRDAAKEQIKRMNKIVDEADRANSEAQQAIVDADNLINAVRELANRNPAFANEQRTVEEQLAIAKQAANDAAALNGQIHDNNDRLQAISLQDAQSAQEAAVFVQDINTDRGYIGNAADEARKARKLANEAFNRCRAAVRDRLAPFTNNGNAGLIDLRDRANRASAEAAQYSNQAQGFLDQAEECNMVPEALPHVTSARQHRALAGQHAQGAQQVAPQVAKHIKEALDIRGNTPLDQLNDAQLNTIDNHLRNALNLVQEVETNRDNTRDERDATEQARDAARLAADPAHLANLANAAATAAQNARNRALTLHTQIMGLGAIPVELQSNDDQRNIALAREIVARDQADQAIIARDANNRPNAQNARRQAELARDDVLGAEQALIALRDSINRRIAAAAAAAALAAAAKAAADKAAADKAAADKAAAEAKSGMERIIAARQKRGATQGGLR